MALARGRAMLTPMRTTILVLFVSMLLPAASQAKPKGITVTVKDAKDNT